MSLAERSYMKSLEVNAAPYSGYRLPRRIGRGLGRLGRLVLLGVVGTGLLAWKPSLARQAWTVVQVWLDKAGMGVGPVAALKQIDSIQVNSEADLTKVRPYCTEKGYRVMVACWRMSQSMGHLTDSLWDYQVQTTQGDQADVLGTGSGGDKVVFRMVREGGQWKLDDARTSDGVWLSQLAGWIGQ